MSKKYAWSYLSEVCNTHILIITKRYCAQNTFQLTNNLLTSKTLLMKTIWAFINYVQNRGGKGRLRCYTKLWRNDGVTVVLCHTIQPIKKTVTFFYSYPTISNSSFKTISLYILIQPLLLNVFILFKKAKSAHSYFNCIFVKGILSVLRGVEKDNFWFTVHNLRPAPMWR